MFLLDTNVVSELRKPNADLNVSRWAAAAANETLFVSVVSIFEFERGVLRMERKIPARGRALRRWLSSKVLPEFEGRVLPYRPAAALRCAALHVPITRPERDAMIAATALVHGMIVVTRNVSDFEPMQVATLNPWREAIGSA